MCLLCQLVFNLIVPTVFCFYFHLIWLCSTRESDQNLKDKVITSFFGSSKHVSCTVVSAVIRAHHTNITGSNDHRGLSHHFLQLSHRDKHLILLRFWLLKCYKCCIFRCCCFFSFQSAFIFISLLLCQQITKILKLITCSNDNKKLKHNNVDNNKISEEKRRRKRCPLINWAREQTDTYSIETSKQYYFGEDKYKDWEKWRAKISGTKTLARVDHETLWLCH